MAPTRQSILLVAATGLELSARWQSQARRALAAGRTEDRSLATYARLASVATRLQNSRRQAPFGEPVRPMQRVA
jgi:hypothetical protein